MNKLKILLMIVILSFFNTSSYADENYTIDSLEGFNWSMGLSYDNDKILVADGTNNIILVYDKIKHELLNKILLIENNCNGHIHGIIIYQDTIYSVKSNESCIVYYNLEGKFLKEFGTFGDEPGEFNGIMGITLNNNKILVADGTNNRIQIFDLEGKFLKEIKSKFNSPHQLLIIENYMYVLDTYNYKVKIFDAPIFEESNNENNSFMEIFIILILISLISFLYIFFMRKSKNENSK